MYMDNSSVYNNKINIRCMHRHLQNGKQEPRSASHAKTATPGESPMGRPSDDVATAKLKLVNSQIPTKLDGL